jgi:hypothetical protein
MADEPKVYVTPLQDDVPAASPAEEPQTAPADPAPAADPAPSPAEPGDGISPEPERPDPPPKAEAEPHIQSEREKLISKLTGVEEEPPSEDDEAKPPPATPETAETPPPDADKDTPADAADQDMVELTNESAKTLKPAEYRRKVNRLITRIKEAAPLAEIGKDIIETCEKHQLDPADYRAWVALGLGVHVGDEAARTQLKQIAIKAGLVPASTTAAMPADFEAKLAQWEEDVDITPKVAKQLRAMFGKPNTPAPEQPNTPAPAAPAAPAAVAPVAPAADPAAQHKQRQDAGFARMVAVGERYKVKLGDARWKEIQPALSAALKARKALPEVWDTVYETEIERILVSAPKPRIGTPPLRPGSTPTPAKPVFKSARERLLHDYSTG